jgi:putative nucleotidyltransferase with HDIG domain
MTHPDTFKKWELKNGEASGFQLDQIKLDTVTDFPLFIHKENAYVLLSAPGYKWQEATQKQLLGEGRSVLYYHTADSSKVEGYLKLSLLPKVDSSLAPAARVINVTDIAAEFTRVLYEGTLTASSLVLAEEISTQMVACVREDITCVGALGKLANHHWYTYYHSARVSAYSIAMAIEMGINDVRSLEEIAVGCLLHDIGKSKIDLNILNSPGPLSAEEWGVMRRHPEMGEEVVHDSQLTNLPREIILHHHERLDGGGYPHKLNAGEILKEVRIAAFADTFDALTTNRPYQPSRSRFEAMDLIRHRFLDQLDRDCFKAMILILQKASKKA